jgi:hypothetical protein
MPGLDASRQGMTFSDSGQLTYLLDFTDGSSGVFTSQFTPVPEPASVGLVAVAGLGVAGLLRRRRQSARQGTQHAEPPYVLDDLNRNSDS